MGRICLVYFLIIDFSLEPSLLHQNRHPSIYHSWPCDRNLLLWSQLLTPCLLRIYQCLPFTGEEVEEQLRLLLLSHSHYVWVGVVGVVERKWSSQTQLFVAPKLSSAPTSSPFHSHHGCGWGGGIGGFMSTSLWWVPMSPSLWLPLYFLLCAYFH